LTGGRKRNQKGGMQSHALTSKSKSTSKHRGLLEYATEKGLLKSAVWGALFSAALIAVMAVLIPFLAISLLLPAHGGNQTNG
jgi:hypothetical protein